MINFNIKNADGSIVLINESKIIQIIEKIKNEKE